MIAAMFEHMTQLVLSVSVRVSTATCAFVMFICVCLYGCMWSCMRR